MIKSRVPLYLLTAIICISLNFSADAQSDFEGKVLIEISAEDGKTIMDYYKKENSVRIEISGEQTGVMIFKPDKTLMIVPGNKMYMEFEGSILDMAAKYSGEAPPEEKLKEVYDEIDKYKTGESKVIHGYTCEKYLKADNQSETEIWMTGELGKFLFMSDPSKASGWMAEFANKNFFPMLVTSKDLNSGKVNRLEVKEVVPGSLDENLFNAPAGYIKMTMPSMGE